MGKGGGFSNLAGGVSRVPGAVQFLAAQLGSWAKAENRKPKTEANPKLEARKPNRADTTAPAGTAAAGGLRFSVFGIASGFGFRASAFARWSGSSASN
jgi:hypothetical protein